MKYSVLLALLFLLSCGNTSDENEVTSESCRKSEEAQAMNLCTFKLPIQETGFMCPQGTPYIHQFEGAAICSEDPTLSEGQFDLIEKDGILACDESQSEFCKPLTLSEQRSDDCDTWMLDTTCLDNTEAEALRSACKSAAIGASNLDWSNLGECPQQANNSQLGGGDFCVEISSCFGEKLRVCHKYNDTCFNLRAGRLATCDVLAECTDDPIFRDTCDVYVTEATPEQYEAFKECAEYSNNAPDGSTICNEKMNCANALLGAEE